MEVWCAENGVSAHTMVDNVGKLRKEGVIQGAKPSGGRRNKQSQAPPACWTELTVRSEAASNMETYENISITIGAFCVSVPEDFKETTLTRVCKVLVGIC